MALKAKIKEVLYQLHARRAGRHTVWPLRGFIQAVELVQGQNVSVPDPTVVTNTLVDSNVNVDASGTGRLYGCWITAGDADVRVEYTDADIVIASVKVPANGYAEAYFNSTTDSIGVAYATDLEIDAKLTSDGTTAASTTARPTVTTIWGDDAINTSDANLMNTNYG